MKYVTFSYDDNAALDERLLKILDRYGARCTFNLNSGMPVPGKLVNFFLGSRKMLSLDAMRELLADTPHEIACHGEGHKDLLKLSETQMRQNIANDKKALEEKFHRPMHGFIYPFGSYSDTTTEALRKAGFSYTRTTVSTHAFDLPEDFLVWHPTCHHNDEQLFTLAEQFIRLPDAEGDHLFYIWGHAWEYGVFKNWDRLRKLLQILSQDPSIHYVTNWEAVEALRK